MSDLIKDAVNAIGGLLHRQHKDLVRHMRTPTPQKVTFNVVADAGGLIGGGFANPNPILIYQCPMSHEAWIHRISISSPSGTPKTPLTTGQLACVGGSNELQFFLPLGGNVAPVQITEGFASAIHLNAGAVMKVYGDSFTAGTQLRIDLQVMLTTGMSEYTPLDNDKSKDLIILE